MLNELPAARTCRTVLLQSQHEQGPPRALQSIDGEVPHLPIQGQAAGTQWDLIKEVSHLTPNAG